jgi:hypothetical protein
MATPWSERVVYQPSPSDFGTIVPSSCIYIEEGKTGKTRDEIKEDEERLDLESGFLPPYDT